MKNLLIAAAMLGCISSANAASDGADQKVSGEMRFRYYNQDNADFQAGGTDSKWYQRTKLGYTLMKGEDLTAHIELLAARQWGIDDDDGTSADPTKPGQDDGNNGVNLHEAWVFWKAMDNLSFKVGRGALDVADGLVISKNDWFQVPYAFDGGAAVYFTEWANVTAFGVRAVDTRTLANSAVYTESLQNGETNFYGLSVDVKSLPEMLKMVNVHLLQQKSMDISDDTAPNDIVTDTKSDKLRYGFTVGGDVSMFDYKLTHAGYQGNTKVGSGALSNVNNDIDTSGWMWDATAGATLADVMNMRLHGTYHMDSGDEDGIASEDGRYEPFYYNQHDNAGMMDMVTWGNLTYFKLGASLEPMEMLTVGLDWYNFSLTEKVKVANSVANPAYKSQKELANGRIVSVGKQDIGQEVDLWAKKSLSNGAEFMLRYSVFMSDNQAFDEQANSLKRKEDTAQQIFAQAKFGF